MNTKEYCEFLKRAYENKQLGYKKFAEGMEVVDISIINLVFTDSNITISIPEQEWEDFHDDAIWEHLSRAITCGKINLRNSFYTKPFGYEVVVNNTCVKSVVSYKGYVFEENEDMAKIALEIQYSGFLNNPRIKTKIKIWPQPVICTNIKSF